jgi:hypothetical protein
MTFDFQSWMRAVWMSVIEPTDMAGKVLAMQFERQAMWTALALIAVLNVLLLALLQAVSPVPVMLEEQTIVLSPFAYVAIIAAFLTLLVFAVFHVGRLMGGAGSLLGALTLTVWFQAMSLTSQAIQVILVLLSPAIAGLFGVISLGAIIWAFVNFINVLHGFASLGKAAVVIVFALIGTVMGTVIVMALLGVSPSGGTI